MNKLDGFIGQAGTGKTTKVFSVLNEMIKDWEWRDTNSILALTFMHGSRRRLASRLQEFSKKGIKVECQTLDSFCLRLVQRHKKYLGISRQIHISDFVPQDKVVDSSEGMLCGIEVIRDFALRILEFSNVRKSISDSFPIVIVDEFQDCDGLLLKFVQKISTITNILIAADDFQRLDKDERKNESIDWLNNTGTVKELTEIHRTKNEKILSSAKALRTNNSLGEGVEVLLVPTSALAAWHIAYKIWTKKWGLNKSKLAIISPTRIDTDAFFKDTIKRLSKPFEKMHFPGMNVHIEGEKELSNNELLESLPRWKEISVLDKVTLKEWIKVNNPITNRSCLRALRLMNLRGSNIFLKQEFAELTSRHRHSQRMFSGIQYQPSKIALTIHQAKNREFDFVIVLWSYKNQKGDLYSRKLLYNALTRAKLDALIIMQFNPKKYKNDATIRLIKGNYDVQETFKRRTVKKEKQAVVRQIKPRDNSAS